MNQRLDVRVRPYNRPDTLYIDVRKRGISISIYAYIVSEAYTKCLPGYSPILFLLLIPSFSFCLSTESSIQSSLLLGSCQHDGDNMTLS